MILPTTQPWLQKLKPYEFSFQSKYEQVDSPLSKKPGAYIS